MNDNKLMNRAADNIRILAASMVEKANSGHPGGAMGGADFVKHTSPDTKPLSAPTRTDTITLATFMCISS